MTSETAFPRPEQLEPAFPPLSEQLERRLADLSDTDPQCRAALPSDSVTAAANQPGLPLSRIVETFMLGYAERPALGTRAWQPVTDPNTGRTDLQLLPRFETITYRELWSRVTAVAGAWHHDPENPVRAGDFVCTVGFTGIDYTVIDLACIYLGAVAVPMQNGTAVSRLAAIFDETRPRVIATSIDSLASVVEAISTGTAPAKVVIFDYLPEISNQHDNYEAANKRLAELGSPVVLETLTEALHRGADLPTAPLSTPNSGEDPLSLLIYTSGSTGTPKGAMSNERRAAGFWLGKRHPVPQIGLHYLPMSHLFGRAGLYWALAMGGTGFFASRSDLTTLFDDIALVAPTSIQLVPRVCDMVFQRYQRALHQGGSGSDREVKDRIRHELFGDRLLQVVCGTAPLAAEMAAFIESVLDVPLIDGYGSTESGTLLLNNVVQRPPVLDYKLVDVPELGYFTTDTPHPRGELLVKTTGIMDGYYNRPELTASMFDEDGYYRTGDIMAETEPDRLVYVDRRNNVLKLAQGEFVAVSNLEAEFARSPLIRQIFVYGNSERAYLLAVIVPTPEISARFGADRAGLEQAVAGSLHQVAKQAELNSYEIPRAFLIETEPFSQDNGLLSSVGKLLRPALTAHYRDRLEQLYSEMTRQETDTLQALRAGAGDRSATETVTMAAAALLSASAAGPDAYFTDLGGDSLSALTFSTLLEDIFGVEVPVGVIVDPTNTLAKLARYIETERESTGRRASFASVHGADATRIRATDLALEKFLAPDTLTAAATIPGPRETTRTVLLTGANGYLGRFQCLEWLQRLAPVGGTLICLVRGTDPTAARARLDAAFDSGDAELSRYYRELADQALEVLPGDIGEPNLGLAEADWNRLAAHVDRIVHPAALVNHVLPYRQLFGPNVVGTAELIRLALSERIKPVDYLSTVSIAAQIEPATFTEDGDVRLLSPVRSIDESYANGYANSKWAGEVLLREANDRFALPVRVFRSDMILAHSRYVGQLNVPDMFTRLLLSLVATGIAPDSFYRTDAEGNRGRAHYDGLPVDFIAEAITELSAPADNSFHTYDVANPHDDDISLDTFVDWLIEAGHPIRRIQDYSDWFTRFETALRALPDRQRRHSVLPLLAAFRNPGEPIPGSLLPTAGFRAAAPDIPHLSRELIEKYLTDLHALELL